MIQGVAFDMDGLMFDTERLGLDAWNYVGRITGFEMPKDLWVSVFGYTREDIKRVLLENLGEDFDYEGNWNLVIDYINSSIETNGTPLKPGLFELLDYLKENGYRMAVASSTPRNRVEYYLKNAGVDSYFEHLVCGDMVKRGKPEPDIYLEAARIMGLKAKDCLALEDSPRGLLSAHRAGMKPVMIPDLIAPDKKTLSLLYAKVPTLREVIPLLEADRAGKTRCNPLPSRDEAAQ